MELLSDAQEFIHGQSTDTIQNPHNIRILLEDGSPRVIGTVYRSDGETKDLIHTASEYTQLHNNFQSVVNDIRKSVQVTEDEIVSSLQISDVPSDREQYPTEEPYSSELADARVKVIIERDLYSNKLQPAIKNLFIQFLSSIDPDLKDKHISNFRFSFSDESTYTITDVSLILETPNPHRYYQNVSSLEEFVENLNYTNDSTKSLIRREGHSLRLEKTHLWDSLYTIKNIVKKYIRSTVELLQNRILADSYQINYIELNKSDLRYTLFIPITDNIIGKTKQSEPY